MSARLTSRTIELRRVVVTGLGTVNALGNDVPTAWSALCKGVSGVGPKVAMSILATMTYDQLSVAVASDDVSALTAVPGIGKRSAQKLLLELKPKMDVLDDVSTVAGPMGEVREALEGLGYGADEIRGTLADMPGDLSIEELLKRSLQRLGKAGV